MSKLFTTLILLFLFLGVVFSGQVYARQSIDWATINPMLEGVASIKSTGNPDDETECLLCHKKYIKAFGQTIHAKLYVSKHGKKLGSSCETCHGPMRRHLKGKTRKERNRAVVSFKTIGPKQKNRICLQCHDKNSSMFWRGSPHEMSEVSCSDCHYVMRKKSRQRLIIHEKPNKACFLCHRELRAKTERVSHMPVREGKMQCTGCHNPHGGFGPSLLKRSTINETCAICHQEKRGPMLWEHAPVRENCVTCHDPHGSNYRPMLKIKVPYLCQQCHMDAFHSSSLYDNQDLTTPATQLVGKACLNCHSVIHGSNHPSGARFQR